MFHGTPGMNKSQLSYLRDWWYSPDFRYLKDARLRIADVGYFSSVNIGKARLESDPTECRVL